MVRLFGGRGIFQGFLFCETLIHYAPSVFMSCVYVGNHLNRIMLSCIWKLFNYLSYKYVNHFGSIFPFFHNITVSSIPDSECWKVYSWWQREPHLRLSQPCFWQSVWSSSYTAPRSDPDHFCDAQRIFSWRSYWENHHWPWEPFPQHIPCYMWTFSEFCCVRTCITYRIVSNISATLILAPFTDYRNILHSNCKRPWAWVIIFTRCLNYWTGNVPRAIPREPDSHLH